MGINIQNAKIDLIQWLTTIEDSSIILKIMELKNTEKEDWWYEIPVSEKKSIELGIYDADNEKLKSHSEVRKIYEKWL